MRFTCIAHTPVEVGQTVKFVASHSGGYAAYLVKLTEAADYKECIGTVMENADAGKAFMVEADYEDVANWHLQFIEVERD